MSDNSHKSSRVDFNIPEMWGFSSRIKCQELTPSPRSVLDNLAKEGDKLLNVEVKSESAVRSASQIAKDNAMATEGGTIVGKNAPADLRGQTVKIETEVRKVTNESPPE